MQPSCCGFLVDVSGKFGLKLRMLILPTTSCSSFKIFIFLFLQRLLVRVHRFLKALIIGQGQLAKPLRLDYLAIAVIPHNFRCHAEFNICLSGSKPSLHGDKQSQCGTIKNAILLSRRTTLRRILILKDFSFYSESSKQHKENTCLLMLPNMCL